MFQRLAYDDWNQGASTTWANAYSEAVDMVRELPSAQPERKKGRWLVDEDGNMECPFCGNTCGFGNYCNECGADMRGEQDEVDKCRTASDSNYI